MHANGFSSDKYLTSSILFRPLLKLVDRLLLVGMLRDEDVEKLLIMINPETWDPTFQIGWLHVHNSLDSLVRCYFFNIVFHKSTCAFSQEKTIKEKDYFI